MMFPWVGLFEQLRLADVFVHYDDVHLPNGRSFVTRVQVKSPSGMHWLTVPVLRRGTTRIDEVRIDESQRWRDKHLKTLRHCYSRAPHFEEMYALAERVYGQETDSLSDFNIAGIEEICRYLELSTRFLRSSTLGTTTRGTQKLADIAQLLGADRYVTGLGALNYLDYAVFEALSIRVEYMDYERAAYPQLYGDFVPYVTVLDCIANCGQECRRVIRSGARYWKDVVDG